MRPYNRSANVTAYLIARVRVDRPLAHVEPRPRLRSPMTRVPGDRSVPTEPEGRARPARSPAEPRRVAGTAETNVRSVHGRETSSLRSASLQFQVRLVARVEHGALGSPRFDTHWTPSGVHNSGDGSSSLQQSRPGFRWATERTRRPLRAGVEADDGDGITAAARITVAASPIQPVLAVRTGHMQSAEATRKFGATLRLIERLGW